MKTKRIEIGHGRLGMKVMTDDATGRPALCFWYGDHGQSAGDLIDDWEPPSGSPDIALVATGIEPHSNWKACEAIVLQVMLLAGDVAVTGDAEPASEAPNE